MSVAGLGATARRGRARARRGGSARHAARYVALGASLAIASAMLLTPTRAAAQPGQAIFARANEAYARGDYAEAIRGYELLVESGVDDADVAYDLATANAQIGRWGHAIRWFERAQRLRPGDEGVARGLDAARAALGRERAEQRGEAVVRTRPPFAQAIVRGVSATTLGAALLVLDVLFFGALVARRRLRAETPRLALGIALPLLGIALAVVALGLAVKLRAFEDGQPAIVLARDVPLREAPDRRAQARGTADEGELAHVVDEHGDFVRVRLAGERDGWAAREQVGTF